MPPKVVVRVRVDQHAALHNLVAEIDPTAEFSTAINNHLVPSHRLRFDLSPSVELTDVRPLCGDRVEV